ncbi:MAG: Gfo/Idh/MocA family oxidoreductase [Alphaproteobacteria bacterium]|nr:Gfo/Idh/MocA family oxidoreductase [Alphaproteobacteria bacterium]
MSVGHLNIGIIGAARVAVYAMMAPAREVARVQVTAIAARDPARAKAFAAEHGIATVHTSYDALISDPSIDLVYVATPPAFHAGIAINALAAGKHVLVEKPFSMNAAEAREVLAAGARAGRRVFEAFHYRHHALWHRIVEICRSGALGKIVSLDAAFHAPIPKTADEFRWNASIGGGALMDLGCYPLQWVRVATGEEPVVEGATMRMVDGVDAATEAVLRFPGGATATVACRMDGDAFAAFLNITCERGTLKVLNPLAPQMGHKLDIDTGGKVRSETIEGPSTFAAQLQAVAATLLDDAPFPLSGDDPMKSMAVIDAVRAAAGKR